MVWSLDSEPQGAFPVEKTGRGRFPKGKFPRNDHLLHTGIGTKSCSPTLFSHGQVAWHLCLLIKSARVYCL